MLGDFNVHENIRSTSRRIPKMKRNENWVEMVEKER